MHARLLRLAALALACASLLAPAAAAEQHAQAGPLVADTTNSGDGDCDAPGTQRSATATFAPDEVNRVGIYVHNSCSVYQGDDGRGGFYRFGWYDLQAGAYRCTLESCFNVLGAGWYWMENSSTGYTYRACWSNAIAFGVVTDFGCPSLDGSPPPLLPALP